MDSSESRIDAKIRRQALLKAGIEDFWIQLCAALEAAARKLNEHWNAGLVWKINDGNSVMRITAPARVAEDQYNRIDPYLEVRFDRNERKVVARLQNSETGSTLRIKADLASGKLVFDDGRSPLAVAETLVAEKLLKLNLDADD